MFDVGLIAAVQQAEMQVKAASCNMCAACCLLMPQQNVEYEIKDVDYAEMKSNRVTYPFGQCPR
jgi:MinD superfamily P-loop ATPase